MSLSHRKSQLVTLDQLAALPEPQVRGAAHQPIPHALLVRTLKVEAEERGYIVKREQLAINRSGSALFGTIDLMPPGVVGAEYPEGGPAWHMDRGLSLGFRNSTNSTMALKMVAGSHVFVCDNMVLSGDMIAVLRRNTIGLDLEGALRAGFEKFVLHASTLDIQIAQLQATQITDVEAKAKVFDIFAARILPVHLFDDVEQFYFHPADEMLDCQPRTSWGLHNAFTRTLKSLPAPRAFSATIELGRAFGLTENPN